MTELVAALLFVAVASLIVFARLVAAYRRASARPAAGAPGGAIEAHKARRWSMDRALSAIERGRASTADGVTPPAEVARRLWQPRPAAAPAAAPAARAARAPASSERSRPPRAAEAVAAFDEEWLVPTEAWDPAEAQRAVSAAAGPSEPSEQFDEPPTRRERRPRDPFDVATVSYPSSLSVAHMYARSILGERGAPAGRSSGD